MTEIVRDGFGESDHQGQSEPMSVREATTRFGGPRRRGTPLMAVREATRDATLTEAEHVAYPLEQQDAPSELEQEVAQLRALVADLDLRVREQVEIERMRDLELGRLEQELEHTTQRLAATDIELFHERRRAAELDRRWNVLNALFEDTASSLVETGATLHAISSQRSYRAIVALIRMMRRHRGTQAILQRVTRPSIADQTR